MSELAVDEESLVGCFLREPARFTKLQLLMGPDVSRKVAQMIGVETNKLVKKAYELSGIKLPRDTAHFAANYSRDKQLLVSCGDLSNVVCVWRVADMSLVTQLERGARGASFDESGERIVLAGRDGCSIWHFGTPGKIVTIRRKAVLKAVFAGADSVWTQSRKGTARLMKNLTGEGEVIVAEKVKNVTDVRWHGVACVALLSHPKPPELNYRKYMASWIEKHGQSELQKANIVVYDEASRQFVELGSGSTIRCHLTENRVLVDDVIYDVATRLRLVTGASLGKCEHEYEPDPQRGGSDLIALGDRWVDLSRASYLSHYLNRMLPLDQALVLLMIQQMEQWRRTQRDMWDDLGPYGTVFLPVGFAFDASVASLSVIETGPPKSEYRFSTVSHPHLRGVIKGMPIELQRIVAEAIKATK